MRYNEQLLAYLATLAALVLVVIIAAVAATFGNLTNLEAIGFSTVTAGLIGALNRPSQRHVTVDNPPNQPVPTDPQ